MTDLFDWRKSVRPSDPETSHEAAREAGQMAARHHKFILGALKAAKRPLAAEEIGDVTFELACDYGWELNHVQVGKRLCELERAGLIVKTAEKHKNRSGRHGFRYALSKEDGK
jgi:hypothetical protein